MSDEGRGAAEAAPAADFLGADTPDAMPLDHLILRFRGPAADVEAHANVAYWMRSYDCEGAQFQIDTLLEAADQITALNRALRPEGEE